MSHFDFGIAAGVMAVVGLSSYLGACAYYWVPPRIEKVIEAMGFGATVVVGVRLVYGAFNAAELCSMIDADGKVVEPPGVFLKFGEHTWEVAAGGVVLILASIYSLIWVCRQPAHIHRPPETTPGH